MKVLFVDDALSTHMKEFPGLLEKYGRFTEIIAEGNVMMAKKWLSIIGNDFDVAIIDHFISHEKGTDLGVWINNNYPHISCILLTGGVPGTQNNLPDEVDKSQLLEIVIEALESGFSTFWLKSRVVPDINDLFNELDRFFTLPGVVAKQKLKQNLISETKRADIAENRLQQSWDDYVNGLRKEFSAASKTAYVHILLLFIEKSYSSIENLDWYTLNFTVPFLERQCDKYLKGLFPKRNNSISIGTFKRPKSESSISLLAEEIIPKLKSYLDNFKIEDQSFKLKEEWKSRKMHDDKYFSATITNYFQTSQLNGVLSRKILKVFLDVDENYFEHVRKKFPKLKFIDEAILGKKPI